MVHVAKSGNRHSRGDLQQMQSLPLEAKILMTQRRIRDWVDYWHGDVYVSFSGGKDSTVLKHIVDGMYDDIASVFVNTGLEYPEIQSFVREIKAGKYRCFNSNVTILRPKMRFDDVIKKHGYPVVGKRQAEIVELGRKNLEQKRYSLRLRYLGITVDEARTLNLELPSVEMLERYEKSATGSKFNVPQHRHLLEADFRISAKCCDELKKKPAFDYQKETGLKPIVATMAEESLNRESAWIKTGCNSFDGKHPLSQPMAFWTEQDVLHYIKRYGVPYCPVYGEIRRKRSLDAVDNQCKLEDTLETTGCKRTGCVYCLFGCHLDASPNRIQSLKETHPNQYRYCVGGGEYVDGIWQPNREGLGLAHVMDVLNLPWR